MTSENVRCTVEKFDIDKKGAAVVRDLIVKVYQRELAGNQRQNGLFEPKAEAKFVQCIKDFLDHHLKPDWNVMLGQNIGYAAKYRKKTLFIGRMHTGHRVLIFKAPEIEVIPDKVKAMKGVLSEPDLDEIPKPSSKDYLRVTTQFPDSEEGDNSEVDLARRVVQKTWAKLSLANQDVMDAAQSLRVQLTVRLGPIWHVVVGDHFVAEVGSARDCDLVLLSGDRKRRVMVFKHRHKEPRTPLEHLREILPIAALCLICLVILARKRLCVDEVEAPSPAHALEDDPAAAAAAVLPSRTSAIDMLCGRGWSTDILLSVLAGIFALATCYRLVVKRLGPSLGLWPALS
eukprot:GDKH01002918.1.p1 GENE.GDKH01002918.1~~GDKH01002918.1.p1  ORF type:complete len:344 (-),score=41.03 GDKH01002918.1:85-1116(-)